MFWRVFRYTTEMSLDDVVSVQERQLSVGLDPDLQRAEFKTKGVRLSSSLDGSFLLTASSKLNERLLTLNFAYFPSQSSEVTASLNFPDFENRPKQVPSEIS